MCWYAALIEVPATVNLQVSNLLPFGHLYRNLPRLYRIWRSQSTPATPCISQIPIQITQDIHQILIQVFHQILIKVILIFRQIQIQIIYNTLKTQSQTVQLIPLICHQMRHIHQRLLKRNMTFKVMVTFLTVLITCHIQRLMEILAKVFVMHLNKALGLHPLLVCITIHP